MAWGKVLGLPAEVCGFPTLVPWPTLRLLVGQEEERC